MTVHAPISFHDIYGDRVTVTGSDGGISLLPVYESGYDTNILVFNIECATQIRDHLTQLIDDATEARK